MKKNLLKYLSKVVLRNSSMKGLKIVESLKSVTDI